MITLNDLDTKVQYRLRNIVGSPLTQGMRISAYNDTIDFLQSKANWKHSRKVSAFDYLNRETDYSFSNLGITDFKQWDDLRLVSDSNHRQSERWEEIDPPQFSEIEGREEYYNVLAFEDRDNDKVMRVQTNQMQGDTIIDEMEDLTTGRTWASDTVNSCATTLAADTTRVKTGSACLKFNIDTTQSANTYAKISTTTVLTSPTDGTDLENNGYFRFWLGLHSLTSTQLSNISSIRLVWGTDSSNYWYQDVTTTINNGSFKPTWNRMSFSWSQATKVGSPSASSLAYFEIRLTYNASFTSCNNIRVDQIKMFTPVEMELVYFSNNFVQKGTALQNYFSTSTVDLTEKLLLPQEHSNLFINLALQILFPQKEKNNVDYERITNEIKTQLPLAIGKDGYPITRENNEFSVRGNSNGRDFNDDTPTQW